MQKRDGQTHLYFILFEYEFFFLHKCKSLSTIFYMVLQTLGRTEKTRSISTWKIQAKNNVILLEPNSKPCKRAPFCKYHDCCCHLIFFCFCMSFFKPEIAQACRLNFSPPLFFRRLIELPCTQPLTSVKWKCIKR